MILLRTLELVIKNVYKVHAQSVYDGPGLEPAIDMANIPTTGDASLTELILNFINMLLSIAGVLAVAAVVVAGLYLVIGGVSEDNRKKSRDIIFYAVIGLLIIIFSKVIISFVTTAFL